MAQALTACFDLPANPRAAGWARRLVTELLEAWNRREDAEVARLLVSEVVTNAVRFVGARHALRLEVVADDLRVRIAVIDGSDQAPYLRDASDTDESGRGMHLIAALASEWGVRDADPEETEPGKGVWFDLPTPPTAPSVPRQPR
nr:ATP-binding protein [Micromonospora sp. DSM 115978]